MGFSELFQILISLFTLTLLEVVLGVDNLVFIAILSGRLPQQKQKLARRIGLMLAWVTRLILLGAAVWLIGLTKPLFHVLSHPVSGKDLFLGLGGLFLLYKGTTEIYAEYELVGNPKVKKQFAKFVAIVTQIALFDIIFSLDSILTAIGLTHNFWIMATAITIAIIVMIVASEPLTRLLEKYPSIKILALSFLLLIGMVLVADGAGFHVPRGYIYFAVCFSLVVQVLNTLIRHKQQGPA